MKSDLKAKVKKAREIFRDVYEKVGSYSKIATMLGVTKIQVHRWIKLKLGKNSHPAAIMRFLNAADRLQLVHSSREKCVIALIPGTTESLPALLNEKIDFGGQHGVEVKFLEQDTISQVMDALNNGDATIAIAPSFALEGNTYKNVERFFEIATIDVYGIFPELLPESQFPRLLAEGLREGKIVCGCLPNADYRYSLVNYLKSTRIHIPATGEVRTHKGAYEALAEGKLHAVVGHPIFIDNCWANITKAKDESRTSPEVRSRLNLLRRCKGLEFSKVTMTIFLNSNRTSSFLARASLGVLNAAVNHLHGHKKSPELRKIINELLGLAEAPHDAAEILDNYDYDIKSFQRDALLRLWQVDQRQLM